MNELTFSLKDNSGRVDELNETISVTFTVPDDMSIWTFHRYCKQFAAAMGYAEKSIEKYFGETCWD